MKFLICIPVELDIVDTKRATIKAAGKRKLVEMARTPEALPGLLRGFADSEDFLCRAPEPTYAERAARDKE